MKTVEEIRTALSSTTQRKEKVELCREIGRHIDRLIIEHTDESKVQVIEIIAGIKDQEITCLLGAQIHHILTAEPKYGKEHTDHYHRYRSHHHKNGREGKVIPTVDELFLD